MLSYWVWLAIFVFIPIIMMLALRKDLLIRYKKAILLGGVGSLAVAVPWDHFAIHDGLWWFPKEAILGIWFLGLPIEEWFFISCIGMEITMMAIIFLGEKRA
jgi:lycopene cyclase domain-containing protein